MRRQLAAFDPSEAEFRTIFQLQQEVDWKYGNSAAMPKAEADQHRSELSARIESLLGPDRASEYRLALDPGATALSALAFRLELPSSAARDVIRAKTEVQQRASAVRADGTLDPTVRNQQLAALADEAEARVRGALGTRGLDAYRQNGGSWIAALRVAPATPAGRN